MDVVLMEKAPELVRMVAEAVKNYGVDGVTMDPFYSVTGAFCDSYYTRLYSDLEDEINAVIDFATEWDIDPSEWELDTPENRYKFAVQYLAIDFDDPEEGTESYCDSIINSLAA